MKVSVIIPVYNAEKFLLKNLGSVLKQTYPDIEVIIINDGSTDDTLKIIQSIEDDRLILVNQENGGVSAARNEGIRHITGDYVVFVDADDCLEATYIEVLVKAIITYKCDMVCCGYTYTDTQGKIVAAFPGKSDTLKLGVQGFISREELMAGMLCHGLLSSSLWNKMFRSDIIKNLSFDTDISIGEDLLFLAQYIIKTNSYYFIQNKLYNYFINPHGAMKNIVSNTKFNSKWISEWEAIRIFESIYTNDSQMFRNALNYKKIVVSNKILSKAKKCGYWDENCEQMLLYIKSKRMKTLGNPFVDFKLKMKTFTYFLR